MLKRTRTLLLLLSGTLSYAAQPVSKPQESYAAYWTSEPGWITELQLKNNLPSAPLTVTPVLRLASGREIAFDSTTIPPGTSVSVWVNQGLLEHASELFGQPGSYGSVVFRYTSPNADNLYATVLLSVHGEPISFPMRSRSGGEFASKAASLEGIWWQPGTAPSIDVLVIGNHSDNRVSGTLRIFDASGKSWRERVVLGPHESQRMSTSDLVKKAGLTGFYGGISFVTENPISAIDAAHFVYDEVSKFSASEDMTRRDPNATLLQRAGPDAKNWTMYAPMLALASPDPALRLPHGTSLQPTLFIRNTSTKNIAVDLSLTWRGDSAKGQVKLPQMRLAPFATQQMQIGTKQSLLRIPDDAHWGLVTLNTDALPDDLVAIATSTDASERYNLPSRFVGGIGGHFAGGEWRIDANHNQIAVVSNIGSKPSEALLTLHYDSGQKSYELQQTIAPGDQMWVNIAQLVRDRVVDHNGNTLPIDIGAVTYELQDLAPGLGNLNVGGLTLDDTFGFSSTPPPCPTCCAFSNVFFNPDSVDLVAGTADSVGIDGINSCTNDESVLTPDFGTWGSDNVAVAKASYAQVQGVGPGSTTVYASGFVNGPGECQCSPVFVEPTLPVTVQLPTSLKVISANVIPITSLSGCTLLDYGIAGAITYQVLDQNGAPINSSAMEPQEKVVNVVFNGGDPFSPVPNWVDIGPSGYPGTSKYTNSNGQFLDAAWGACSNGPFVEMLTQPIGILLNNTEYTVRISSWTTYGIAPNKGSMTNGNDVSLSN